MRKLSFGEFRRSIWSRVAAMTTVMFFILLADAILSDWVPNFMQDSLGSPIIMGLVMAFSSVIGFVADLIFPQILRGATVRLLTVAAIIFGLLFATLLLFSTWWPILLIFLLAMVFWGIYYELLGFANQQFVAETASSHQRASVWAVKGMFSNLAYFLGPILGGLLAVGGNHVVVLAAGFITILGYAVLIVLKIDGRKVEIPAERLNIVTEAGHWWILLEYVWPILIISFVLGIIDATFWTTGTVLTEVLAKRHFLGGLFLPIYMLPSLFVGFVVLKWGIYRKKKKWAEIFMLLAGILLIGLAVSDAVLWMLLVVFLSSMMLSITHPLTNAVYSDILSRMGRENKHMIGLSNSMVSLAYIVGPVLAGFIASRVGEKATFVSVGAMTAVVSLFLLAVTPKKLRLPQQEIETWE